MKAGWLVVDASVAIKWIVPEEDAPAARELRLHHAIIAPQLIYAECTNIIWKKVRRGELTRAEAIEAGNFVDSFDVETVGLEELVPLAIDISLGLDHPAYDCFYLALATMQEGPFVTADAKLWRKVRQRLDPVDAARCMMLTDFGRV